MDTTELKRIFKTELSPMTESQADNWIQELLACLGRGYEIDESVALIADDLCLSEELRSEDFIDFEAFLDGNYS